MKSEKKTSAKQKKKKSGRKKYRHILIYILIIIILLAAIALMAYKILNSQDAKKDSRLAEAEANRAAQAEQQAAEAAQEEAEQAARTAEYQAEIAAAASAAEQQDETDQTFAETPVPESIASSSAEDVIPVVRSNSQQVTISFGGDCELSGSGITSSYEENGAAYFFQNLTQFFRHDDLTVVNLESPLTTSEDQQSSSAYKADPSYAKILTEGGIDCVSLANDHTQDYGDSGYQETEETLDSAGIDYFGGEETRIVTVKGIKIGFSGINACDAPLDHKDEAIQNINDLKADGAEIVICMFHWGTSSTYTPSSAVQELAHAVIDAGADLIVGDNSRVLQGIELYEGKYICYSLGNLCYGGSSFFDVSSDYYTLIFQVTFVLYDGELQDDAEFTLIPCTIGSATRTNDYCPTPATGTRAEDILDLFYDKICGYIGSEYIIDADTPNQSIVLDGGTDQIGYNPDADAAEDEDEDEGENAEADGEDAENAAGPDEDPAEDGTETADEPPVPDAEDLIPMQ